ncbi:hypothetical protein BSK59_13155 [Paenibacillus odorifer]|uniref:hypothetical protein n=1 Tax=Paenibacillus odorifer TaxID=189426 RepID=UPI00096C6452|nr:hypothetical protein [Paenibacillus odorifer]OME55420.1 hypothetical protein BSK59_13155 [Paenibacillus odorifer]
MNTFSLSNTYLGFTDNMTPMLKARTEKTLNTNIRFDERVITQKEWIYEKIQSGAYPHKIENYSYYSSRTHAMTKPKTYYSIAWEQPTHDGNSVELSNELNKTLYDFACYIVNNNLTKEEILLELLQNENNDVIEAKKVEEKRLEEEKAAIEAEKKEKEEFQEWMIDKIKSYNNNEKVELYLSIFNDAYPERHATQLLAKTFLVYVDNIHVPQCRQALKQRLHVGNKISKKIFYHVTGVKLPNTDKETMVLLEYLTGSHYYGIVPYKVKSNSGDHKKGKDLFYRYINGIGYIEAYGDKIEYKGITGFVFYSVETGLVVIESKSGCVIARPVNNNKVQAFEKIIDEKGVEKINTLVNGLINKNGISPLYKELESAIIST